MKHLSLWRNERGATTTNPKMMPRQHIGFGKLDERPVQKKCDRSVSCKDGGVIPITGCPTSSTARKQGGTCKRQLRHCANRGISYITHAFVLGSRLVIIPLKNAFSG